LRWKFQTRSSARQIDAFPAVDDGLSSAVVVGGTVYAGAHDGYLYALDARTGEKRWEFATRGRVNSTPCYRDGILVFGSTDGFVYAVRAADGAAVWKYESGRRLFRGISYGGVRASPLDAEGKVFVGG
jgi:outer membrane protein assembly factor BamB